MSVAMEIEISGMYEGNYVVSALDSESPSTTLASDAELRDHLRDRGLNEQRINTAMQDFRRKPRKIRLPVDH